MTIEEHVETTNSRIASSVKIRKVTDDAARLLEKTGLYALDSCRASPRIKEAEQLIDLDREVEMMYQPTASQYRH